MREPHATYGPRNIVSRRIYPLFESTAEALVMLAENPENITVSVISSSVSSAAKGLCRRAAGRVSRLLATPCTLTSGRISSSSKSTITGTSRVTSKEEEGVKEEGIESGWEVVSLEEE